MYQHLRNLQKLKLDVHLSIVAGCFFGVTL